MKEAAVMNQSSRKFGRARFGRALHALGVLTLALGLAVTPGCGKGPETPEDAWAQQRKSGSRSSNDAAVADWLIAELLRPGGSPDQVEKARAHLDEIEADGMIAALARGIDDRMHGRFKAAAEHHFAALMAARESKDSRAPLAAWYAANNVYELSGQTPDFGKRHMKSIEQLLEKPGAIGFRAYSLVVDIWADEAWANAHDDVDEGLAKRLGCAAHINLAGPFGTNGNTDVLRSFPAEDPGPWPKRFKSERPSVVPRKLDTLRIGCDVESDEYVADGIFYGESFVEIKEPQELILTASGSTQLWVDDVLTLERDIRVWGVWPKYGVRVHFEPGRHRIVWKMGDAATTLRLMHLDGTPWVGTTSSDASQGYELAEQPVGEDPNVLMDFILSDGVVQPEDELTRYLVAYLASYEGQADVATVMLEPLVEEADLATGVVLEMAADLVIEDPIYDSNQTRELAHELQIRASERDPDLWAPRLQNALWIAEQKGHNEAVEDLEKLVEDFPEVGAVHNALARAYERLSWGPELEKVVRRAVEQFPDDSDAISLGVDFYESIGEHKKVDALLAHLREVDPDTEVFVSRALARRDYAGAIAELKRLAERRPSRKDIPNRIEDIMVRSGDAARTFEQLEEAIEDEPRDVHARLALADAQLARGDKGVLAKALVEAVQAGGDGEVIEEAIDLVEGITELEPFRIDAMEVIADYEKSGEHQAGNAARILDYGAVIVRSDGSSRFLEHELVRVQSEEGIKQFTEMDAGGLLLHLRVIKKDGSVLEPEAVSGKSTVTMPHLEVGDYVEQERILSRWGGGLGEEYIGPSWFFREENVAYNRSEFVIITPEDQPLIIEAKNGVPDPQVEKRGSFVVRRWRVDKSPAAPSEPSSPPRSEFMPQVSVGWNVSFERRLQEAARSTIETDAVDPRIARVAKKILKGKGKSQDARARALYHWVLDNVQEGRESDGRRVIISRSGSLWAAFTTLCQAEKIPTRWALSESRLSSPLEGELSSAQRPLHPLMVVGKGKKATWLTIADKYAPYGTVPSYLRGEPAYLLGELEAKETTVPKEGVEDAIRYEGKGQLNADGSAKLSFAIIFYGTYAASLRNGLSQIPENQLAGIIESRLLGQELQGARLLSHQVVDQKKLDRPLRIEVVVEAPQLATLSGDGLLLGPPFMPGLSGMTPLAQRVTPLMIGDSSSQGLDLELTLPEGMAADVAKAKGSTPRSNFTVGDSTGSGVLHLIRDVTTDAGRITPENYSEFQQYTRSADAALSRAIRISKR